MRLVLRTIDKRNRHLENVLDADLNKTVEALTREKNPSLRSKSRNEAEPRDG